VTAVLAGSEEVRIDSDCVSHRCDAVFELLETSIAMAATRPLRPSQHCVNVFEIARQG
jgi:hypothetical protein